MIEWLDESSTPRAATPAGVTNVHHTEQYVPSAIPGHISGHTPLAHHHHSPAAPLHQQQQQAGPGGSPKPPQQPLYPTF